MPLLEDSRKIRRASRRVDPHFTPIQKMGFPDGIRCWCGEELIVRYGEHGVMAKRKRWLEQHEECQPRREESSGETR